MLEEAGYVERKQGRLDLTPHGVRGSASRRSARSTSGCKAALAGEHDQPDLGRGGDITGELKHYEFGDPFHIEVKETVFEAVRRQGTGTPVKITPEDFMVERTERKVQAATALLIDLSLSMPMRGNWVAAKKVALALHALISTQFPRDRLFLIGFSDYARRVQPEELPNLGWEEVYGTNMQHALLLARRLLGQHRGASRQVLMVTDGEPTAHLLPNGEVLFNWPPIPQTFEETLKEVARCTKDGIVINTFMLDRSPYLMRFIERMTQLNQGRAFFTSPEHLGRVRAAGLPRVQEGDAPRRMTAKKRNDETGLRVLLILGAVVSIAIGVCGLIWTGMLENVLGLAVPEDGLRIARLYGGVMLAIGIGYALAAAQPQRSRSLLVLLFVVPLVTALATIAALARGRDLGGPRCGVHRLQPGVLPACTSGSTRGCLTDAPVATPTRPPPPPERPS